MIWRLIKYGNKAMLFVSSFSAISFPSRFQYLPMKKRKPPIRFQFGFRLVSSFLLICEKQETKAMITGRGK